MHGRAGKLLTPQGNAMTERFHVSARTRRAALTALLLPALLTSCATTKPQLRLTEPPAIACEERAPPEPAVEAPSGSTDYRAWRAWGLQGWGVATAEVEKRVTTAECLDELRQKGVIR